MFLVNEFKTIFSIVTTPLVLAIYAVFLMIFFITMQIAKPSRGQQRQRDNLKKLKMKLEAKKKQILKPEAPPEDE